MAETYKHKHKEVEEHEEAARLRRSYAPQVDIYEKDGIIHVQADMPGVSDRSVDIVLEKNLLTVHGSVGHQEFEGLELSLSEYGVGDYQRVFTLSEEIDRDHIVGSVKNGVLSVTLPKVEAAKSRKIAVSAG